MHYYILWFLFLSPISHAYYTAPPPPDLISQDKEKAENESQQIENQKESNEKNKDDFEELDFTPFYVPKDSYKELKFTIFDIPKDDYKELRFNIFKAQYKPEKVIKEDVVFLSRPLIFSRLVEKGLKKQAEIEAQKKLRDKFNIPILSISDILETESRIHQQEQESEEAIKEDVDILIFLVTYSNVLEDKDSLIEEKRRIRKKERREVKRELMILDLERSDIEPKEISFEEFYTKLIISETLNYYRDDIENFLRKHEKIRNFLHKLEYIDEHIYIREDKFIIHFEKRF